MDDTQQGAMVPEWVATLIGRHDLEREYERLQFVGRVNQLAGELASVTERLAKAEEKAALAALNRNGLADHQVVHDTTVPDTAPPAADSPPAGT